MVSETNEQIILLTGSTGFLGTSFINKYNLNYLKFSKDFYFYKDNKYPISDKTKLISILDKYNNIYVLHLATFYSLDEKYADKVTDANLNFGIDLFKYIPANKIKKIIYTNSVFTFSKDNLIKNSTYVKTKIEFSEFLNNYSYKNKIHLLECFISDTYGLNDNRGKILNKILDSKNSKIPYQIYDSNKFLNYMSSNDIAENLYKNLYNNLSGKFLLINNLEHKLIDILNYIFYSKVIETRNETQTLSSDISLLPEIIIKDKIEDFLDLFH